MFYLGLDAKKNCLLGFANNTGADQPAHTRSLISAFVVLSYLTENLMFRLSTSEISLFLLVTVAEQTNLNNTLLETQKTGFVATRPIYSFSVNSTLITHMLTVKNFESC